jgi:hypothetical protein
MLRKRAYDNVDDDFIPDDDEEEEESDDDDEEESTSATLEDSASDDDESPAHVAIDALLTGANVTSIFAYIAQTYKPHAQFGSAFNRAQPLIETASRYYREWELVPAVEANFEWCYACGTRKSTTFVVRCANRDIGRVGDVCAARFDFARALARFEYGLIASVRATLESPLRAKLHQRLKALEAAYATLSAKIQRFKRGDDI